MRIPASPLPPSLSASSPFRRDALVEAAAAVSQGNPEDRTRSRPLVERVLEGEVLPRPAAQALPLTDYRAVVLAARGTAAPPAADAAAATPSDSAPRPGAVLFYLLHSSADRLTSPLGHNINQHA